MGIEDFFLEIAVIPEKICVFLTAYKQFRATDGLRDQLHVERYLYGI